MSTRGYIGLLKEDGTVDYVYSHFDNYTTGTGYILLNHAKTQQDVERILENGWQDSVDYLADPNLAPRSLGTPKQNCSFVDYLKIGDNPMIEYYYLFNPRSEVWFVATCHAPYEDRSVSECLQGIFKLYRLDFYIAYELFEMQLEDCLTSAGRELLETAQEEGILKKRTIASARKLAKRYVKPTQQVKAENVIPF